MKLMSEITGEDLRQNDVIYIGFIRSMGALREYFFRWSNFSSSPPFMELHHKSTGDRFEWSFRRMLDKSLPGFLIFHTALVLIVAAALLPRRWSSRAILSVAVALLAVAELALLALMTAGGVADWRAREVRGS